MRVPSLKLLDVTAAAHIVTLSKLNCKSVGLINGPALIRARTLNASEKVQTAQFLKHLRTLPREKELFNFKSKMLKLQLKVVKH